MKVRGEVALNIMFLSIFAGALLVCLNWPAKARFYPIGINTAGICFSGWLLYASLRNRVEEKKKDNTANKSKENLSAEKSKISVRDEITIILWLVLFVVFILIFGFWMCIAVYLPLFMRLYGKENWKLIGIYTVASFLTIFTAFHVLMESSLFGGLLGLTFG